MTRREKLKRNREAKRRWTVKHPDYHKQYYRKHKKQICDKWKRWRREHHAQSLAYRKQKWLDGRERIVGRRKRCVICRRLLGTRFYSDHDHAVAQRCGHRIAASCAKCRREPLCYNCNAGLGRFADSPKLLDKAAAYLRYWRVALRKRG
jgi:hypothetical protein